MQKSAYFSHTGLPRDELIVAALPWSMRLCLGFDQRLRLSQLSFEDVDEQPRLGRIGGVWFAHRREPWPAHCCETAHRLIDRDRVGDWDKWRPVAAASRGHPAVGPRVRITFSRAHG